MKCKYCDLEAQYNFRISDDDGADIKSVPVCKVHNDLLWTLYLYYPKYDISYIIDNLNKILSEIQQEKERSI